MNRVRRITQIAVKGLEYINRLLWALSILVLATLMVIVTWQVLMRYFFDRQTGWVFELAKYGMGLIVFLPLARAEQLGQHIRVDAVTAKLSLKMVKILNVVALSLSTIFVGIFVWSAIRYARLAYDQGWNSGPYKLGVDEWPTFAFIAIGLLMLWLNLIVSLGRQISELVSKEQNTT